MRHYFLLVGVISLLLFSCGGKSDDRLENAERKVEQTYPDGKEKVVSYYSNDDKHEKLKEEKFHEDGKIFWSGNFKDEKRDGYWRSWYENGNVWSEGTYSDGKQNGIWKTYYENGQLRYRGSFKNGQKTGKWTFYDANGNITQVQNF